MPTVGYVVLRRAPKDYAPQEWIITDERSTNKTYLQSNVELYNRGQLSGKPRYAIGTIIIEEEE